MNAGRETADYGISTGRPIAQVAAELGLNSKIVYRWVVDLRQALSGEPSPREADADLRAAKKRIAELEMENAS